MPTITPLHLSSGSLFASLAPKDDAPDPAGFCKLYGGVESFLIEMYPRNWYLSCKGDRVCRSRYGASNNWHQDIACNAKSTASSGSPPPPPPASQPPPTALEVMLLGTTLAAGTTKFVASRPEDAFASKDAAPVVFYQPSLLSGGKAASTEPSYTVAKATPTDPQDVHPPPDPPAPPVRRGDEGLSTATIVFLAVSASALVIGGILYAKETR